MNVPEDLDSRIKDIPCGESSENTKGTACSDERDVGGSSGVVVEVAEAEEEECQVKREEQREEGDGRAKGADQQQEGEDEPSE